MKCEQIQKKLLLQQKTTEIDRHLESCEACDKFNQIMTGIDDAPKQAEPSITLDAKILDYAYRNRPSKKSPIPFYLSGAVAALLILGFTLSKVVQQGNSDSSANRVAGYENNEKINLNQKAANKVNAADLQAQKELDETLDTLWQDDIMSMDMTTIEGELFVLSAELYDN